MWTKKNPYKLSSRVKFEINVAYLQMRIWVPTDFSPKPRWLEEIDRWKATEFRLFLLYLGPIVLINVLPLKMYKHFMSLSCVIYILSDANNEKNE